MDGEEMKPILVEDPYIPPGMADFKLDEPLEKRRVGRPKKPKAIDVPDRDLISEAKEAFNPESIEDDPELVKRRDELLKGYLLAPEFFTEGLDEGKIARMKDIKKINRELELSQLRLFSRYNGKMTDVFIELLNHVPKKILKMNPEQGAKFDTIMKNDEALNVLTRYQITGSLLNMIPNAIKWMGLYANDIVKVYLN